MVDLSVEYLGLKLPHPFIAGASALTGRLDAIERLVDCGAAAVVMQSLFQEQIAKRRSDRFSGALRSMLIGEPTVSFSARQVTYMLNPPEYLEQVRRIKSRVSVPVIASLNGTSPGKWLRYAPRLEEAGADAIEVNAYLLASDPKVGSEVVERQILEMFLRVKESVAIPVAAKLSPFYASLTNMVQRLSELKVEGMVLFNRFYQPDIDIEAMEIINTPQLSTSSELLLRLRWLAILAGQTPASLAVSGGVHTAEDAIKAIMCGADAIQVVSAVLRQGPQVIEEMRSGLEAWLAGRGRTTIQDIQGVMSLMLCPDPGAYERAHYQQVLQSWGMKPREDDADAAT